MMEVSAKRFFFHSYYMSQTSFRLISTNSSTILIVSMATKSPYKDFLIDTSHISRQSILDS